MIPLIREIIDDPPWIIRESRKKIQAPRVHNDFIWKKLTVNEVVYPKESDMSSTVVE